MSASRKARGGVSFMMAREAEQREARRDIGLGIVLALALSALAIVVTLHAFAWILSGATLNAR